MDDYKKNKMSVNPANVSFVAFFLGLLSISFSLFIGSSTFKSSLFDFEQQYRQFYLRQAKMLVKAAEINSSIDDKTLLDNIQKIWDASGEKTGDEYICVVDKDSDLIAHTAHPETIGNYAGDNLITPKIHTPETCLADLVESKRDYVGDYISSSGQNQLAAFASIPGRGWVVGIHRSKKELIKDIEEGIRYSKIGFYTICGILMPLSWVLLYLTFHVAERKRKGAEEALLESEKEFMTMLNDLLTGFVVQNRDKSIQFCNTKASDILGLTFEQLTGKESIDPAWHFVHEDLTMMKAEDYPVSKVLSTKKPFNDYVVGIKRPDRGYITWIIVNAIPVFSDDNEVEKVAVNFLDITARIQAEEEKDKLESHLQKTQKMESIGTLAGGIAHDFNNILFPIVGYTEMLLDDIPEKSPMRDNLEEIYTGALRARDLVKQILTFSRQERNEFKLLRLQPVIREAMKLMRSTIPTTIRIRQNISDDCGIIKADPTQIHQVVMNLATNAYHAMEDVGGELKVSLKEMKLSERDVAGLELESGNYACLTVADTGVGMDNSIIEKVFDPFFTTKKQGEGTGMGLSVIHGIVKNVGGFIKLNSEPGKGAEFHVFLPVLTNSSGQQKIQTKESTRVGTEHILVVDDEDAILKMEKQILERLGYQVTTCGGSVEALELFIVAPDKFDMVITDMAMPNIAGDMLASELKKIRPDIPVLLCTGFSEKIPEGKATSMGIQGVLMKPIVRGDLSQKIRDVLDGRTC